MSSKKSALSRSAKRLHPNRIEAKFLSLLDAWEHPDLSISRETAQWQHATPGFKLQAWSKGRLKIDVACGETSDIYDWASLTKIVLSVSSSMIEVEEGDLALRDQVGDWLPELGENLNTFGSRELSELRVRELLTHSAGMTWWKPFFKQVAKKDPRDHEEAWAILTSLVFKDVQARLENGEIAKARKGHAIYSDLDFFLLGEILRRSSLLSIPDQYARVQDRLDLSRTFFHGTVKNDVQNGVLYYRDRRERTAATEKDEWRGRMLRSEVHDENAGSLKGIAPHAGLFGPISDLSSYGLQLRKLVLGERSRLPAAGESFVKRAVPRSKGDWAMGFMMPTRGSASCGPKFSLSSIGHTGFTGTSLWYDPKQDLLVTILSNRVYPTRANARFVKLRPALHSFVVDSL